MAIVPYVRQTWLDGAPGATPISAARFNVIEAGLNDVSFAPAVRVTHNVAQAIASGTETTVTFNTERFDQCGNTGDNMHDNTNPWRLTCRYAGVYQITACVEWSASPVFAYMNIRLNGVTTIATSNVATDYRGMNLTTLYALAVNDYVEVRVSQSSGGSRNINSMGNYSPEFMMVRVG